MLLSRYVCEVVGIFFIFCVELAVTAEETEDLSRGTSRGVS